MTSRPGRKRGADHRTRVGRQRSERTRERIIESALPVFASLGPDVPIIDDFIRAADIARGTFYRHFPTTSALRTAVSNRLEVQLIAAIQASISELKRPEERLATGVRAWLDHARRDTMMCAFVVRTHLRARRVDRQVMTDIRLGLQTGEFRCDSAEVGRDLLIGSIREAMARRIRGPLSARHVEGVARSVLLGLGVPAPRIDRLLQLPMPRI